MKKCVCTCNIETVDTVLYTVYQIRRIHASLEMECARVRAIFWANMLTWNSGIFLRGERGPCTQEHIKISMHRNIKIDEKQTTYKHCMY